MPIPYPLPQHIALGLLCANAAIVIYTPVFPLCTIRHALIIPYPLPQYVALLL